MSYQVILLLLLALATVQQIASGSVNLRTADFVSNPAFSTPPVQQDVVF
jgi:hypothetical protein